MKNVFADVVITQEDIHRLSPHMSGWNKLMVVLATGYLNKEDCKKMIHLEIHNKCRPAVIKRLIGRYVSIIREDLYAELEEHLDQEPKSRGRPRKDPLL